MADKRIQDLTQATSVQLNDLFVLEQSGAAKSLSGQTLITDLATALSGHGGIASITYTPPVAPSLDGTLDITMADASTVSLTITNGNGIASIGIKYGISNSGTDPIYVLSWENSPVAPTDQYPYGWTRISITDTTGYTTNAYSITKKAADPSISVGTVSASSGGSPSATITNSGTPQNPVLDFSFVMEQGDKGDTGDYIEPVVSYGTSTAAGTEPVTWYSSPTSISYSAGNFIWRKTEYTLHDAQTVQSTVTEIIGYIGQNGAGSGTVTQITFNGTTYTDDGTGNVPMSIDASDVGAIEDPSTKSNGQVLTYDSNAGEWVAANPSTGGVNTVNNVGVDAGTTNITLYATAIEMSSGDSTKVSAAIPAPATATPADLGTAAAGSGTTWARSDHVHKMPSASDVGAFPAITEITSGTHDLNDYRTDGIYCFNGDGATITNSPAGQYGWLVVMTTTASGGSVKQFWHRNGTYTINFTGEYFRMISGDGSTTSPWVRLAIESYLPGESFTASNMVMNGFVTSSTKKLMFDLALPKRVSGVTSASVTAMTGTLRGPTGYLNSNSSNVNCVSTYTVTVTEIDSGTNHITINVTSSSAFSNIGNNQLASYLGSLTVTFS